MWNGTILMARDVAITDGVLTASCFRSDYASFVAWRDWGFPDTSVYNCFGSPLILSSDGALIYGRMAGHTLNAGLCYPPSGSLDLDDIKPGGNVDVLASIRRELTEETGLNAGDAVAGDLLVVFDKQRISVSQPLHFDRPARELAESIHHAVAEQSNPELDDVVVLRPGFVPTSQMPDYAMHLAQHLLDH